MGRWLIKKLSSVSSTVMGQAPAGKDCNKDGIGTPFVKVGEFGAIRPIIREWTTDPKKLARKTDVLLCVVGATCGKINLGEDCAIGRSVAAIRPNAEHLDQAFLHYFMQGKVEEMRAGSQGAAQTVISKVMIADIDIPLPPIPEQKRIVAILDEAFAAIDTAIANTEKNLANARELFASYLNAVFSNKEEGWQTRSLGDTDLLQFIDGDRGKNYPKKSDFSDEGYCLFLNTKNVRPDGFNFDTTMFISEDKDRNLRKGKLKRRDVVLTTRGTIGNIALYDNDVDFQQVRINSGMLILRPNEKSIIAEYLFEVLRSGIVKSQIERLVSGAAQPQLPIKTLVKFSIPVPNKLSSQEAIVSQLKGLSAQTNEMMMVTKKKMSQLVELRQSLLQAAFVGELTANSVEEALA